MNFFGYILHASLPVQMVMIILVGLSITSWTFIAQRWMYFKKLRLQTEKFEHNFWSGIDLVKLYDANARNKAQLSGMELIFKSGFKEFMRLRKNQLPPTVVMEGTERAMRVSLAKEQARLEQHLSFLATVGSTSPYIGLFGTVWGIMSSFQALTEVQQATLSMVAPGISEALVATAIGLFAAIPAVMAYNRYVNRLQYLVNRYDTFIEEFSGILYRKVHLG